VSEARAAILSRARSALDGAAPEAPTARAYRRTGALTAAERIELFCERAGEYQADVRRIDAEVGAAVAEACRARGVGRLVTPAGVPDPWRPPGVELVEDTGLTPAELDAVDGVLTGCTVAIAETGTIALTSGPREGRRALSLVPDLHVCVVEEDQIVELVPEAIAILGPLVAGERRPVTLVSGPSATSDIELNRVEGVHGPRNLVVLVAPASVG
jgi:L-lactate dehydrogenase complex protein LldG